MSQVKAIPEGLHTITPQFSVDGCAKAMEWYKKALGAEEVSRAPDPSGQKIWHASMRIGDSTFFLNDTFPEMGATPQTASLWVYTDNVDQLFKRATDAGAKTVMPMMDQFWGDRTGTLLDPFGNRWTLGQHMKNLTDAEIKSAADAFIASMKK
ncbi:MAG: Glyoxalase/bleomycin resistance protein/dioxygenase [Myxococcales bacterium]|nr:Glyoxalase/bleomycin resistance protein/dioxygenase [Myxococcales bacterium]